MMRAAGDGVGGRERVLAVGAAEAGCSPLGTRSTASIHALYHFDVVFTLLAVRASSHAVPAFSPCPQ